MRLAFFAFRQSIALAGAWILLWAAVLLVRLVPWSLWQETLGIRRHNSIVSGERCPPIVQRSGPAWRTGQLVERASGWLPFHAKCLPRAIVVQWLLRLRRIPSALVIAVSNRERSAQDGFHAWVETTALSAEKDGPIVAIGAVDFSQYTPMLRFEQAGDVRQRPDRAPD